MIAIGRVQVGRAQAAMRSERGAPYLDFLRSENIFGVLFSVEKNTRMDSNIDVLDLGSVPDGSGKSIHETSILVAIFI